MANLPVINRADRDTTRYVTLAEAATLYGKTTLTTRKKLRTEAIEPIGIMPTGSVGRPAKLYDRPACEIAFGLLSERDAGDQIMLDVASLTDDADDDLMARLKVACESMTSLDPAGMPGSIEDAPF